jgi:hypothetical protein
MAAGSRSRKLPLNLPGVLGSTNFVDWTDPGPMVSTNGMLQFLDVNATNFNYLFYRTAQR